MQISRNRRSVYILARVFVPSIIVVWNLFQDWDIGIRVVEWVSLWTEPNVSTCMTQPACTQGGGGQHHSSTNIAGLGQFFYNCRLNYLLLVIQRSLKIGVQLPSIIKNSNYLKQLALPACFVMLQTDESHRQQNLSQLLTSSLCDQQELTKLLELLTISRIASAVVQRPPSQADFPPF